MIFAREPFLLHLLAGSETITALDAAKGLLDSGVNDVNERELTDNIAPLHVAAAWNNLAMCQLLIHYGADVDARDIDKRRPVDVAVGECKKFLKRMGKRRRRTEMSRFRKVLAYLFRGICSSEKAANNSTFIYVHSKEARNETRRSCPSNIQISGKYKRKPFANIEQQQQQTEPKLSSVVLSAVNKKAKPSVSSSMLRDEFLSSDNTSDSEEKSVRNKNEGKQNGKENNENGEQNAEDVEEILLLEELSPEEELAQKKQQEMENILCREFALLRLEDLKEKLRLKNFPTGPMDARNRRAYEAKLAKLEIGESRVGGGINSASISGYSPALQKMLLNIERGNVNANNKIGQAEDALIRNNFLQSTPKQEISFFCYLLIDPSRLSQDTKELTFRRFLCSIFYVGKGKRSRPLQHLVLANKCRNIARAKPTQRSEKLKRILQLWDNGEGVISMHLFHNIHSAEAFIREGAMIETIGVKNLTNILRGTFPDIASRWTRQQITEFGALLLHKAFVIFMNERCRPIFEADIFGMDEH